MADANVPTLRIRCPQCHTVMRVAIGSKPTCAKCGYAGKSAAPTFPLQDASSGGAPVAWDDGGSAGQATAEAGAWDPDAPQDATWQEAPAEPEAGWQEAPAEEGWAAAPEPEGWQEAPAEAWPDPEPTPPKKVSFKRR